MKKWEAVCFILVGLVFTATLYTFNGQITGLGVRRLQTGAFSLKKVLGSLSAGDSLSTYYA